MDIWERALGFMDSQALLTAEGLGLFDVLECGPKDTAQVARDLELPHDTADQLLSHLAAMGLVVKQEDGRFVNGPEAAQQLVRGMPGYIGSMFEHVRSNLYPLWGHFEEALREGQAQWERTFPEGTPPNEGMYEDPEALRSFMAGMHTITYGAAAAFAAAAPEVCDIDSLMDIGGASGAFLIALAERNASLRGTVYDLPPVRPIAEEYFAGNGLSKRLGFHDGNFWEDPIPSGYNAYSLGFILHDWDDHGGGVILGKIADASRPGTMLIVGEYLLNEDRTGPIWVSRASLNMLVSARGRERSAREYADWMSGFGFTLKRIHTTPTAKSFLIACRN